MRFALGFVVLAACKAAPPAALSNHTPIRASARPVTGCLPGRLQGVIEDPTGEGLPGVTVIISGGGPQPDVAITDENGAFDVIVRRHRDHISLYYLDVALELARELAPDRCLRQLRHHLDPNLVGGAF